MRGTRGLRPREGRHLGGRPRRAAGCSRRPWPRGAAGRCAGTARASVEHRAARGRVDCCRRAQHAGRTSCRVPKRASCQQDIFSITSRPQGGPRGTRPTPPLEAREGSCRLRPALHVATIGPRWAVRRATQERSLFLRQIHAPARFIGEAPTRSRGRRLLAHAFHHGRERVAREALHPVQRKCVGRSSRSATPSASGGGGP